MTIYETIEFIFHSITIFLTTVNGDCVQRPCVTLRRGSKPTGTTNRQALQKIKLFDLPNNKKWFKFNAYEFFINICKKMTMMMNWDKHYVKYSTNEYINS